MSIQKATFWGYATNDGILPSTIREKAGDSQDALEKTVKYRYQGRKPEEFKQVRVTVEWEFPWNYEI